MKVRVGKKEKNLETKRGKECVKDFCVEKQISAGKKRKKNYN